MRRQWGFSYAVYGGYGKKGRGAASDPGRPQRGSMDQGASGPYQSIKDGSSRFFRLILSGLFGSCYERPAGGYFLRERKFLRSIWELRYLRPAERGASGSGFHKTEMAVDKKGSIFHNKTVRMIEPGAENILVKESLFYLRTQENLTWQILE